MAKGKFNLRSWAFNSKVLRDQATSQNTAGSNKIVHLLGLKRNLTSDTLTFNQRVVVRPSYYQAWSSTGVVENVRLTRNPKPVTIKAKLPLQELLRRHIQWDEPLLPQLVATLVKNAKEIEDSITTELPRYHLSPQNTNSSSNHGICWRMHKNVWCSHLPLLWHWNNDGHRQVTLCTTQKIVLRSMW